MLDFLSGIGDAIGSIAAAIGAALEYILSVFVYLFNVLVTILSDVVQFFGALLGKVGAFFAHLWNGFFKGILSSIWQHLRDAMSWLHDHVAHLLSTLQKIRDRLDRYFRLYVQPYLNMIQRLRQYLHILAIFHIRWAQELDAKLAQVQAEIVQAFATVRASLNALIDIGNAIVDPSYLLRKPALLLSIRRQIPALIRAVTGKPPGYWFPSPKAAKGSPFAPWAPFLSDGSVNAIPSASSLLAGNDGVGDVSAFLDGATFLDASVNTAQPLDYFDDDLYPDSLCPNSAESCLLSSWGVKNA